LQTVVTGAAGFIGSQLAERLAAEGHQVLGIDCFSDYYSRRLKEYNLRNLQEDENFSLLEENLLELNLPEVLQGVDWVFHQAAQAGVRASWGEEFSVYSNSNILATQQLLEAAREAEVAKFIYASSSSVYGETDDLPMREAGRTKPVSPYGVSKLAGEHLCQLYHHNFGLPVISLRYFTVFGARQRPDMAFHIFIKALLSGERLTIFGDGEQSRSFTPVADVVEANLLAAKSSLAGEIFNIGSDEESLTLNAAIDLMEEITGCRAKREYQSRVSGDVRHTSADLSRAKRMLNFSPEVEIAAGLAEEVNYIKEVYDL